jgi:shikimate dehydrogenase
MNSTNFKDFIHGINPETHKTGVFGYPVKHSASPAMQNAAFLAKGLNYIYLSFEIKPEDIGSALNALGVLGFRGINLTIPHKESSLPFLDEISPEASKIKAVNTVLFEGGKMKGFNTDIEGFLRPLVLDAGWSPGGKKAVVLGAGGAARAVAFSLLDSGAKEIVIANRTIEKAAKLAGFMKELFPSASIIHIPVSSNRLYLEISSSSLLVNCTPLGLRGETPLEKPGCLGPGLIVYDLIYKPSLTPLLASAAERGAETIGGLDMLVYQGAASFKIWTSADPPVEVMKSACRRAVEEAK